MTDLSWSAALTYYALGAATVMFVAGTRRSRRRKQNRRIGLPAPQCQRFPDWDSATSSFTRRQAE